MIYVVAMLALLPNAIWGRNVFCRMMHKVNINLCDIVKNNALHTIMLLIYFKDKDGTKFLCILILAPFDGEKF